MTLTKKSLALAMALLMVLPIALLALPMTAQAAPTSVPITAYVMNGNTAFVSFTMPSDGTSYTIKHDTAAAIGPITASPNTPISRTDVAITGNSAPVIVTIHNGGSTACNSVNVAGGVPNMDINLGYHPSLTLNSCAVKMSGGAPYSSNTTLPSKVFYNGSVELSFGFAPNIFSGPISHQVSNLTVTPNANSNSFTLSALRPGAYAYFGGGTYVGGGWGNSWGGSWWNTYDDVYSSLGEREYYGRGDLTYNVNASKSKLEKVGVNRQLLTEGKHYTVSADGAHRTNITLKESFLNTLPLGYNRFAFSFADGSSHVEIRVRETGNTGGGSVGAGNASALRSLTVYNKASTKGKKLGTYSKGADIRVTGYTSSGTYALVDFGGETGYVRADYINAVLADAMTARTSSSSTALYTRKSTSSKYRYAKVNRNTVLTLLAREGSYWKVDFNDETLYVRAKDVKDLTVG